MLGERVDEGAHERENLALVGDGSKHQTVVAERVLNGLGHIVASKVKDGDLLAASLERRSELLDGCLQMAVDARVGNGDALVLGLVARPRVVSVEIVAQVLGQHGTVERADDLNVQIGGLLEHGLHELAELAHDTKVVTTRLAGPAFRVLDVVGAELAKAVSAKEHLVGGLVGEEHLGPVHVGGADESQAVAAQVEHVALFDDHLALGVIGTKVVDHHAEGAHAGHDLGLGIALHKGGDASGVVGLHVVNDQVIGRTAVEHGLDVAEPLVNKTAVDRISDCNLLAQDNVAVVCHTVLGHVVLALEQVNVVIVDANVADILGDLHQAKPPR